MLKVALRIIFLDLCKITACVTGNCCATVVDWNNFLYVFCSASDKISSDSRALKYCGILNY